MVVGEVAVGFGCGGRQFDSSHGIVLGFASFGDRDRIGSVAPWLSGLRDKYVIFDDNSVKSMILPTN